MIDNNDIDINKYTAYEIQLNNWTNRSDKAIMATYVTSEIATHFINCNHLYDEIINMINDDPICFIQDFYFDVVHDYKYFDERIMKQNIYEKYEPCSDTNTDISSDNDYSSEIDYEDYEESDDDYSQYEDAYQKRLFFNDKV